ncbi:MAG: MarR family transcriptional regulator [Aquisalimonadaceae bacterium]
MNDRHQPDNRHSLIDRLGPALGDTARACRMRLDQRLRPLGLSQAKWQALLQIARGGEGMTQTTLAQRIGVEGPTLVGLLDRLARDGWIERRPCSEDRRVRRIHLTAQAHEALQEIEAAAAQLRKELFGGIPEGDLLQCLQVLQRIRERAEALQ